MFKSDSIDQLAAALVAAQSEIEDAAKSRSNPAFRSQYATLGDVWDAIKPALTKHGLAVVQFPASAEEGHVALETTILHASGQYIGGTVSSPLAKQDPQGVGSAITYLRRYGLSAALGVCPDDDDGNAASGKGGFKPAAQQQRPTPAAQPSPAPELSLNNKKTEIVRLAIEAGKDKTFIPNQLFPGVSVAELTEAQWNACYDKRNEILAVA